MGIELRLPNITGATEKEQLLQVKSYLYQLSEQLQWAFDNINTTGGSGNGYVVNQAPRGYSASSSGLSSKDAEVTFAALKSLIIKSADIVDAYYEEINKRLEGIYIAESDFGKFAEQTSLDIKATSEAITQTFENVQIIAKEYTDEAKRELDGTIVEGVSGLDAKINEANGRIDETNGKVSDLGDDLVATNGRIAGVEGGLSDAKQALSDRIQSVSDSVSTVDKLRIAAENELKGGLQDVGKVLTELTGIIVEEGGVVTIGTTGTIKSGLLYTNSDGVAVYGVEVGQNIKINDTEVYSKIARLTSQGLYFFNPNSYDSSLSDEQNAVAYISDKKLYISQAEILTSFKIGKLVDYVIKTTGDVVTKWEGG